MKGEKLSPAAFRQKYLQLDGELKRLTCWACGEKIGLAPTLKGNNMPVDLDQDGRATGSHFATCTQPDRFRKGKPRKSERKQQAKASGGQR